MPTINLTDPVNDTVADAALIANNNSLIEALLNGGLDNTNIATLAAIAITKLAAGSDGQILTTAAGAPVWSSPAAVVGVPPGTVSAYAGTTAPSDYLLCDGTSYLRATYPNLFGVLSTTYGAADGTHFNVPDMRQRVPVGKHSSGTFSSLASVGGAETVALSEANLPPHTHTILRQVHGFSAGGINYSHLNSGGGGEEAYTTSVTGSGTAVNNLQPYMVLNYIIKT